MLPRNFLFTLACFFSLGPVLSAQSRKDRELPRPVAIEPAWADALTSWRSIGPANMGGRIIGLAVDPSDISRYWAATASGGLLATRNRGFQYEHQFQYESCMSIGHVAVAPSDSEVVWVGTGEANPRNSVSYGDGVYKSTDGGATWKCMGLEESFQIGRIAIHPTDPDTVYVGALGRLWGPSEQRGLYKTTDGGKSWEQVLFVDELTGVIDIDLHPQDPETLLVATYERERDLYDSNAPAKKWGPGSGLWRSSDGGQSWVRLEDQADTGLPRVDIGRIGVDWHRADPNIVYAIIETERIGRLPEDAAYFGADLEKADVGLLVRSVSSGSPAERAGLKKDDVLLRWNDEVLASPEELGRTLRASRAGDQVQLEFIRDTETFLAEELLARMPTDEGERRTYGMFLGGQDPNIQDEQLRDAQDNGGVYRSSDGGLTWERVNSLNPRPMYFSQIRVDPSDPKYVYVLGIALYRSEDGGETFTTDGHGPEVHVDHHALWINPDDGRHMILGNDGGIYVTHDRMKSWDHHNHVAIGQFYHVSVGHRDLWHVYGGLQDNGSWGAPNRAFGRGLMNSDWISVGGGDGFLTAVDPTDPEHIYYESQNGALGRVHLKSGERAMLQIGTGGRRFHWKTPFALSHHAPRVYYAAGDRVYRSLDQGSHLAPISPELSRTSQGAATAFSESPLDRELLYVGTEDGALWRSQSFGRDWTCLYGEPERPGAQVTFFQLFRHLALAWAGSEGLQREAIGASLQVWFDRGDLDQDGTLDDEELRSLLTRTADDPKLWRVQRPITDWLGNWRGEFTGDMEKDQRKFELSLTRDEEGQIAGRFDSKQLGSGPLEEVQWDEESTLSFLLKGLRGQLRFQARKQANDEGVSELRGEALAAGGLAVLPFEATRKQRKPRKDRKPAKIPGAKPLEEWLEQPLHVAALEASRHVEARLYLTLDGHRSNDDAPYIFCSEDFGATWRPLHDGLPRGSTRVLREDRHHADLLYLGTEFGAYASLDRGQNWFRFGDLPHVAVHEFAQPPHGHELVAGTHGRSLWVADVSTLRGLLADEDSFAWDRPRLLAPRDGQLTNRRRLPYGGTLRRFEGENPSPGPGLVYFLAERGGVSLHIEDREGEVVREFDKPKRSGGLHRVDWNLRSSRRSKDGELREGGRVRAGDYTVVLTVDGERLEQTVSVLEVPGH